MGNTPLNQNDIILFALNATRTFGEQVAARLDLPLAEHEEREFEDGEHKTRPLTSVRGRDVFVIQSLYSDDRESVNDKFCRLLFFIGCLKDASAARITAVLPYLAYARKDRKTQPRDPVTTRYVAAMLEAVGADRVVTLDVHNLAAFQNAFRCHTDHLDTHGLFADHFAALLGAEENITVVSPDVGGVKRAESFRQVLGGRLRRELPVAFMEKARARGVLSIGRLVGDVAGNVAVIIDDLISTGGTLLGAAQACKAQGASRVFAAAAHGVFVGKASQVLAAPVLERVAVTDTILPFRLDPALVRDRLTVLPAAPLVAEAIQRIHTGGSLVELLAR